MQSIYRANQLKVRKDIIIVYNTQCHLHQVWCELAKLLNLAFSEALLVACLTIVCYMELIETLQAFLWQCMVLIS